MCSQIFETAELASLMDGNFPDWARGAEETVTLWDRSVSIDFFYVFQVYKSIEFFIYSITLSNYIFKRANSAKERV